jgi:hypothetical protein
MRTKVPWVQNQAGGKEKAARRGERVAGESKLSYFAVGNDDVAGPVCPRYAY